MLTKPDVGNTEEEIEAVRTFLLMEKDQQELVLLNLLSYVYSNYLLGDFTTLMGETRA